MQFTLIGLSRGVNFCLCNDYVTGWTTKQLHFSQVENGFYDLWSFQTGSRAHLTSSSMGTQIHFPEVMRPGCKAKCSRLLVPRSCISTNLLAFMAHPRVRAVEGEYLQPIACWNSGFESCRDMDIYFLWVLCVACEGPIVRPEQSKQLRCVNVRDLGTSRMRLNFHVHKRPLKTSVP